MWTQGDSVTFLVGSQKIFGSFGLLRKEITSSEDYMKKTSWHELSHDEQILVLKNNSNAIIIEEFAPPPDVSVNAFERFLEDAREFWRPDKLGTVQVTGAPPNKQVLIGAWRDLNKTEALLELIDNSIDAWIRRRKKYPNPKQTAKTLRIYIDIDTEEGILRYEDTAGGVKKDYHNNLVNPGNSETEEYERSIGSYRTGGKKAIFKLAEEAIIETRYLDPDEYDDTTFHVHLDKSWLEDPLAYEFNVYPVSGTSTLEKGHTRYVFRTRDKKWLSAEIDEITLEIRKAYSLLITRIPDIEIYFLDRTTPLEILSDFYSFSGAKNAKLDVRPQRVKFKGHLEHKGKPHEILLEIVLGCRTTTALVVGNDKWGIDIYGNNRLFISQNQDEILKWFSLPKGAAVHMLRGFINIIGPNIFVPWDTHKRHLSTDHPIIDLLKSKPIKELFAAWGDAYQAISRSSEIKETIKAPYGPWVDDKKKDVNIEFDGEVLLPLKSRTRTGLPDKIHRPKAEAVKNGPVPMITVSVKLTQEEFRSACSINDIDISVGEKQARTLLGDVMKNNLL
jgi:Histidine kinase-, DNA gyrase B-, and HSP90-like ATPase